MRHKRRPRKDWLRQNELDRDGMSRKEIRGWLDGNA